MPAASKAGSLMLLVYEQLIATCSIDLQASRLIAFSMAGKGSSNGDYLAQKACNEVFQESSGHVRTPSIRAYADALVQFRLASCGMARSTPGFGLSPLQAVFPDKSAAAAADSAGAGKAQGRGAFSHSARRKRKRARDEDPYGPESSPRMQRRHDVADDMEGARPLPHKSFTQRECAVKCEAKRSRCVWAKCI